MEVFMIDLTHLDAHRTASNLERNGEWKADRTHERRQKLEVAPSL
jgi:hypothetical protein